MKSLEEAALEAIGSGKNLGSNAGSVYRDVYEFTYRRRKYVVKIDKRVITDNGGCEAEAKCWEQYKGTPAGSILAPVIAWGTLDSGLSWLVMPKLQTLRNVYRENGKLGSQGRCSKIIQKTIYPRVKDKLTKPKFSGDRISCKEFGIDLHWKNWGMDNRGNWFAIDYSDGGN
jgi:hypothetical protein